MLLGNICQLLIYLINLKGNRVSYLFKTLFSHPFNNFSLGSSLAVQWLGLCASTAGGMNLIPGQGTKTPHAVGATKPRLATTLEPVRHN